jgi:hypothetical protein
VSIRIWHTCSVPILVVRDDHETILHWFRAISSRNLGQRDLRLPPSHPSAPAFCHQFVGGKTSIASTSTRIFSASRSLKPVIWLFWSDRRTGPGLFIFDGAVGLAGCRAGRQLCGRRDRGRDGAAPVAEARQYGPDQLGEDRCWEAVLSIVDPTAVPPAERSALAFHDLQNSPSQRRRRKRRL